jgi:predicted phage terminase large subunit-like protein
VSSFIGLEPTEKQLQLVLSTVPEVLYGGAAGGGKSIALLMAAAKYLHIPGYNALLLRRSMSDMMLPGALLDLSHQFFGQGPGQYQDAKKQWIFPSGATLTFGFLDAEADKYRYQGAGFQFIGFDELTQFSESQYLYLFSRCRKSTILGVPTRIFSASNPGGFGHDWVKARFIATKTKDRLFIPSVYKDNPHLDHEDYAKKLQELDPVTRRQLQNGDWDVLPSGNLFNRLKFVLVNSAPPTILDTIRFWDFAGTTKKSSDFSVGVKMVFHRGQYCILDVIRVKASPVELEKIVANTAHSDGRHVSVAIEQEPGSAGVGLISHYIRNVLPGYTVHAVKPTNNKVLRAQPFASAVDNLNVSLVRAGWNQAFIDECVLFPQPNMHDDQVDAASGAFEQLANRFSIPDIEAVKVDRTPKFMLGYD